MAAAMLPLWLEEGLFCPRAPGSPRGTTSSWAGLSTTVPCDGQGQHGPLPFWHTPRAHPAALSKGHNAPARQAWTHAAWGERLLGRGPFRPPTALATGARAGVAGLLSPRLAPRRAAICTPRRGHARSRCLWVKHVTELPVFDPSAGSLCPAYPQRLGKNAPRS